MIVARSSLRVLVVAAGAAALLGCGDDPDDDRPTIDIGSIMSDPASGPGTSPPSSGTGSAPPPSQDDDPRGNEDVPDGGVDTDVRGGLLDDAGFDGSTPPLLPPGAFLDSGVVLGR